VSKLEDHLDTIDAQGVAENLAAAAAPGTTGALPSVKDLADWVFFAPATGRIWFDKQRSLLMHASTFGALRRELIEALGLERAREVLRRIGYAQGQRDAELVRERWPTQALQPGTGPQLHTLEGFVKSTLLGWKTTPERGLHCESIWTDSVEADEHVAAFGRAEAPVCWTLAGYAEGYASTMRGTPFVMEEVECVAAGHTCCRAIMRPADAGRPEIGRDGERPHPHSIAAAHATDPSVGVSPAHAIIGTSAPLANARRLLEQVAGTRAAVLLRGESGVGKELFASLLHQCSPRRDRPFVAINCAAIPEHLVEAELFGVERGAYTGATSSRPGRFERADGGTLFLDELGLMSLSAQAKLLRVLQENEIERVGGTRGIRVDVRVVAATNVDLWDEVETRRFRRDLFYRLNVFPIDLPPLRARRNDIPLLIDHFVAFYAGIHGKQVNGLTNAAMEALLRYDYPGNVRELQNLIERGVICAGEDRPIDRADIFRQGETFQHGTFILGEEGRLTSSQPVLANDSAAGGSVAVLSRHVADVGSAGSLDDMERSLCQATLQACAGNVSLAARRLGLTRPTLEYRLRKWGLLQRRARGVGT